MHYILQIGPKSQEGKDVHRKNPSDILPNLYGDIVAGDFVEQLLAGSSADIEVASPHGRTNDICRARFEEAWPIMLSVAPMVQPCITLMLCNLCFSAVNLSSGDHCGRTISRMSVGYRTYRSL
jgi:hypothetical protein